MAADVMELFLKDSKVDSFTDLLRPTSSACIISNLSFSLYPSLVAMELKSSFWRLSLMYSKINSHS